MARFLFRRFALAVITLFVLSLLVFFGTQVLPGDVGRRILGPFATQDAVDALNGRLGTDRPLFVQYGDWIGGVVRGDLGDSLNFARPVTDLLGPALANSAKLALVAFVIVVPLGIVGGVIAGLKQGRWLDRLISVGGLSVTVIPEFVTAIVVILLFGIVLGWLPVTARPPAGSSLLTQVRYLILPAIPLVLVLFGYIARITRAGVVEALNADYTRTAILKGLSRRVVIARHVLRNALLPTIAVVATQVGYLIGGLVAIEVLFTYQGVGQLLFTAAQKKDFPLLQGGVLVVGATYLLSTLLADIAYSVLNPRIRLAGVE
ncbi:MAG TPA: ABC transporter permease [Acidimicrobiia bacterium]|nr:ABC transporter permease [Acidimicrobiia bacterium]